MKFPMDLVLISLLLVLMYHQPSVLTSLTTSVLGRMMGVGLIAHIALVYGRNAGLLGALIFILLLHNKQEGFSLSKDPRKNPPWDKRQKRNKLKKVLEGNTAASPPPASSPTPASSPAPSPPPAPSPASSPPPAPPLASSPPPAPAQKHTKDWVPPNLKKEIDAELSHPLAKFTAQKNGGVKLPGKVSVKERIQNIISSGKKKKRTVPVTQTNKTDLESLLQRVPHINSQTAKGEHGGLGFMKKLK